MVYISSLLLAIVVMLAIDTETNGIFIHKGCRAFTISAACDQANTYLWNFEVDPFTRKVIYEPSKIDHFRDTIDDHEELVFHHANFDLQVLDALGVSIEYMFDNHDIHDTMVMSHAYKSDNPHGLKQLGLMMLGMPEDDETTLKKETQSAQAQAKKLGWAVANKHDPHPSLKGTQKEWYKTDYWVAKQLAKELNLPKNHIWHTICDTYATQDAERTLGIYYIFQELMTQQQINSYDNARRLIKPILDMQNEGITLIPDELREASHKYNIKQASQTQKLRTILKDKDFNHKSPKQLQQVLFTKYKFEPISFGKTGDPSTKKTVIAELLSKAPKDTKEDRYRFLLALKALRKTTTTCQYVNNYSTHKIYDNLLIPFYKQTSTGTNRLSAENPNSTNVGKDDMSNPFAATEQGFNDAAKEESFKLRNLFGPRSDEIWSCIDFQQSQLLIFAVVSNSKALLKAFEEGEDVHQAVARVIFKKDNISAVERTAAKAINFGLLFGAGPAKIEETAGMPGLYNLFLSQFPNAKSYLNARTQEAKRKGYVHTLGGYRLYVPRERPYAAPCYVIQGSEAEIVRNAMCSVNEYTQKGSKRRYTNSQMTIQPSYAVSTDNPYRMIMMVHDELVFRSNRTDHTHLTNIMNLMEAEALKLGVPAKVDADIVTTTWAEKKSYLGPCEDCGEAVVAWKTDDHKYQDCIGCNPTDIGLIY